MTGFKLRVPEPIGENLQPIELVEIDFDVVAKKDDVELLQDAVLEISDALRKTTGGLGRPSYLGPACEELEKRTKAGQ